MTDRFEFEPQASAAIDDIYRYTRHRWGGEQASRYIDGIFAHIAKIAAHEVLWRRVPVEIGIAGYFCRFEHHFIYWKTLADGRLGVFAILHESMNRGDRLRPDRLA